MIHQIKTFKLKDFVSAMDSELTRFDTKVNDWLVGYKKEIEVVDIKRETCISPVGSSYQSAFIVSILYVQKSTKETLTEKKS